MLNLSRALFEGMQFVLHSLRFSNLIDYFLLVYGSSSIGGAR